MGKQQKSLQAWNALHETFFASWLWEDIEKYIKPDINYWKKNKNWTAYETACLAFNIAPRFFEWIIFDGFSADPSATQTNQVFRSIFNFLDELYRDCQFNCEKPYNGLLEKGSPFAAFKNAASEELFLERRSAIASAHTVANRLNIKLPKELFGVDLKKPLHTSERDTFLKLLCTLVIQQYGSDFSGLAPRIEKLVQETIGEELTAETIKEKLDQCSQFNFSQLT